MRNMIAIGLAGALATASVGATTQSAQASGGALIAGIAIGAGVVLLAHHFHPFATTAYATTSYAPAYRTYSLATVFNSHTAWCKANYRSYNEAIDSFTGYDGQLHRCVSPAY